MIKRDPYPPTPYKEKKPMLPPKAAREKKEPPRQTSERPPENKVAQPTTQPQGVPGMPEGISFSQTPPTIQAQADLLGNTDFSVLQRQEAAQDIADRQGNTHMLKVMDTMRQGSPQPRDGGVIARQNQPGKTNTATQASSENGATPAMAESPFDFLLGGGAGLPSLTATPPPPQDKANGMGSFLQAKKMVKKKINQKVQ